MVHEEFEGCLIVCGGGGVHKEKKIARGEDGHCGGKEWCCSLSQHS